MNKKISLTKTINFELENKNKCDGCPFLITLDDAYDAPCILSFRVNSDRVRPLECRQNDVLNFDINYEHSNIRSNDWYYKDCCIQCGKIFEAKKSDDEICDECIEYPKENKHVK
jgi:hypothetical protein